jgi:putative toxin-antitoxin system antitoxin component (TIGR02293 family)
MSLNAQIINFFGGPSKLKIKKSKDYSFMDIVHLEREGLPSSVVEIIESKYDIDQKMLAHLLHISTKTLERRIKEKKLASMESSNATRLAKVYEGAKQVLGSDENVRGWLKTNKEGLVDIAPIHQLDSDKGTEEVISLLNRIEYGILA